MPSQLTSKFGQAVCEALGINPGDVSRIVVDIDARDEAMVSYFSGTELCGVKLLKIDLGDDISVELVEQ